MARKRVNYARDTLQSAVMDELQHSLYDLLLGETGIRKLVNRFYDLVDSAPEAAGIRSLLPKNLERPREKLLVVVK